MERLDRYGSPASSRRRASVIYRVDYLFALFLAGAALGALVGRFASTLTPARAARGYFVGTMLLLGASCIVCVARNALAGGGPWSNGR